LEVLYFSDADSFKLKFVEDFKNSKLFSMLKNLLRFTVIFGAYFINVDVVCNGAGTDTGALDWDWAGTWAWLGTLLNNSVPSITEYPAGV